MKILLINQPLNNRGDESAHKAFVRGLLQRMPDAFILSLFVESEYGNSIRQFSVDDPRVTYYNLHPKGDFWQMAEKCIADGLPLDGFGAESMECLRRFYADADVVVCAPGGICMGEFQDWWHLFYLRMAQSLGKKLVYYGRSFGPFPEKTESNRTFRDISMELLHYFSFLSIRDRKTEEIAEALSIPYATTLDSAFLDSPKVDVPEEIINVIGEKPYMVFVPNSLLWHPAYKGHFDKQTSIEFYSSIIDKVKVHFKGINIVMLPQTFGFTDAELCDVNFFHDIATYRNDPDVIVLPDTYSSDTQQTIISNARMVIGARYHSIVFALNQSVPFVALNYEHKIEGMLSAVGCKDCIVDIRTALDTQEGRATAIDAIERKLPMAESKADARTKAKAVTAQCLDSLVELL